MKRKAVYTTGEAADITRLSQQTIIRCFDTGRLKGFLVPGSRFRRIPRDKLIRFMKDSGIPLDRIASDKVRVLIVDDDPHIVDILEEGLRQNGRFETRTAQNGWDAGFLTKEFQPDVVLLDYLLPDINGNKVCRKIREDPELASIKILIISGVVNPAEVEALKKAGADDFIKKPFNIENVVQRILELVEA